MPRIFTQFLILAALHYAQSANHVIKRALAYTEWPKDLRKMDEGIGGKRQSNPRERANIFSIVTFMWVLLPMLCLCFSIFDANFQLYLRHFQKRHKKRADWRRCLRYFEGLSCERFGGPTGGRMGEREKEN